MADNWANAAKKARTLAITQIITGVLLIGFGIGDRLVFGGSPGEWTGYVYFGVWIGVWMCITGGLGIPGSAMKQRTSSCNAFAGVFMGFSITSAVFGVIIIISYSFGILSITTFDYGIYEYSYRHGNYYHYRTKVIILAIMLVLGLVTFGIGIWAATFTCLMKPCTACSGQPQAGQGVVPGGYVVAQGPGGVPITFPVQQTGGGVTVPYELMPPQGDTEVTDQPPAYHQISTTGGPSSTAEGDPPPPYSKDEQLQEKN